MEKYFCENLVLNKEPLRIAYICKKTNKVCPRVSYGVDGEASPDVLYSLVGCELSKKSEEKKPIEEVKKDIEKVVEKISEETNVESGITEEIVEQPEESKEKIEEKQQSQKQNNYKKKNKQYNK